MRNGKIKAENQRTTRATMSQSSPKKLKIICTFLATPTTLILNVFFLFFPKYFISSIYVYGLRIINFFMAMSLIHLIPLNVKSQRSRNLPMLHRATIRAAITAPWTAHTGHNQHSLRYQLNRGRIFHSIEITNTQAKSQNSNLQRVPKKKKKKGQ